eukprot:364592-Chlamydomonas_euryale.AAC.3
MARHGMAWHGMTWHGKAWHSMAQHGMAQHGTAWHGTAWHGMAQHGMAQHGTAWHGTAWHDTAQHGTTWHLIGNAWMNRAALHSLQRYEAAEYDPWHVYHNWTMHVFHNRTMHVYHNRTMHALYRAAQCGMAGPRKKACMDGIAWHAPACSCTNGMGQHMLACMPWSRACSHAWHELVHVCVPWR